jgi:hypothetical protein
MIIKMNEHVFKPEQRVLINTKQRARIRVESENRFYEIKELLREGKVQHVLDNFSHDDMHYVLMRLRNEANDWWWGYNYEAGKQGIGADCDAVYSHESWILGQSLDKPFAELLDSEESDA